MMNFLIRCLWQIIPKVEILLYFYRPTLIQEWIIVLTDKQMEPDSIRVVIEGEQFTLTHSLYAQMSFFQEWKALSPQTNICVIEDKAIVTKHLWKTIIQILEHEGYNISKCPKVRSNQPKDYLSAYLAQSFQAMPLKELNKLYNACHFLKVEALKTAMAAFLATKVYIGPNPGDYQQRMKANNVKAKLTHERQQSYRQNYPFLDS